MRMLLPRLALLSIGALLALSCRLSTEPTTPSETLTGRWQGREWKGDASVQLVRGGAKGDTLYVSSTQPVRTDDGMYEEWLSVRLPFHGAGAYVLDSTSVVVRVVVGGDVISTSYYGIGASAGLLNITGYAGLGSTIDGTMSFAARSGGSVPSPTYRFDNGRFRASVDLGQSRFLRSNPR
jgi:hypothetical protein